MKGIVIIEDKREELLAAIAAVKVKLGIADVEGKGLEIDDIGIFQMGFELVGGISLFFAHDLTTADKAIEFAREKMQQGMVKEVYVLTDLMFPLLKDGSEQANGVSVILDAVEAGFPVSVCSDTDHHEVRFLPKLCRNLQKSNPSAKINLVLDKKDWKKAVELLFS
ncbi:MAG: hypothetical protein V4674_01995 [Patescibacteria group bacterium]